MANVTVQEAAKLTAPESSIHITGAVESGLNLVNAAFDGRPYV
jgi:hypothetical protein